MAQSVLEQQLPIVLGAKMVRQGAKCERKARYIVWASTSSPQQCQCLPPLPPGDRPAIATERRSRQPRPGVDLPVEAVPMTAAGRALVELHVWAESTSIAEILGRKTTSTTGRLAKDQPFLSSLTRTRQPQGNFRRTTRQPWRPHRRTKSRSTSRRPCSTSPGATSTSG